MSKLLVGMVVGVFVAGFAAELVTHRRRRGLPSLAEAARDCRRGFWQGFHGTDGEPLEAAGGG